MDALGGIDQRQVQSRAGIVLAAEVQGFHLVASIALAPGDRVFVAAGDVLDAYGNTNGNPSAAVTVPAG